MSKDTVEKYGLSQDPTENRGAGILTVTGKWFYPNDIRQEDLYIKDIAYALAVCPRFNGHVPHFRHYSIAEHSMQIFDWMVRNDYDDPSDLMWALLHDAGEAYVSDVPRPIKHAMGSHGTKWFHEYEERVLAALCDQHGLPQEAPEIVRKLDRDIVATEIKQLFKNTDADLTFCDDFDPVDISCLCLPPEEAFRAYLIAYAQTDKLLKERQGPQIYVPSQEIAT